MRARRFLFAVTLAGSFFGFADPATGWRQTAAGTYDYNDTANWVEGEVNGIFGEDLTLAGAQVITFGEDTTLASGLAFSQKGAYPLTFRSSDATPHTLTLSGDLANNGEGLVDVDATLKVDLGNGSRTITAETAAVQIHGVVSNGGLVYRGASALRLYGENTFAGGLDVYGTGWLCPHHATAFGTGTITFEGGNLVINEYGVLALTADNPLVFKGDLGIAGNQETNRSLDFGEGAITIVKPFTLRVGGREVRNGKDKYNTYTLGGQVAAESPYSINAMSVIQNTPGTSDDNSTFVSKANLVLNGTMCLNHSSKSLETNKWQFEGEITGGGELHLNGRVHFTKSQGFQGGLFVDTGTFTVSMNNQFAQVTNFYIGENATFCPGSGKGYTLSGMLASNLIDPSSKGMFALAADESGAIDLANHPYLTLGCSGSDRALTGVITPPSTGVLKLGGGGKTVKLGSRLPAGIDLQCSTGSVRIDVPQPDFDGKIESGGGYAVTLGSTVEMPKATIEGNGGSVRFTAAAAGEFVRCKKLILRTVQFTADAPTNGDVTHRIDGDILIGAYRYTSGGITRMTLADTASCASVLTARDIRPERGGEMVRFMDNRVNANSKFVVDAGGTKRVGSGSLNTIYAPLVPFMVVDNGPATYDEAVGFRGLNANEYTAYSAPYEGVVQNEGENVYVVGSGTFKLTGEARINSLWMTGDVTLNAEDGKRIEVNTGLVSVIPTTTLKAILNAPLDFGARRGYVYTASGYGINFYSPIHGQGGLTIAHGGADAGNGGDNLYMAGSTYSGDVYVFYTMWPKVNGIFPDGSALADGTKRTGNVYLFGRVVNGNADVHVTMGGLNGACNYEKTKSGTLTVGAGDGDGVYSGLIGGAGIDAGGSDLTFVKTGKGKQVITACGLLSCKWASYVRGGGELQVDGVCRPANRNRSHFVIEDGTLSGCGIFCEPSTCGTILVYDKGVIAPGSADVPNVPMKVCKSLEMVAGSQFKFYMDQTRLSQAILSEGCSIVGKALGANKEMVDVMEAIEIPVTVTGGTLKSGEYVLIEADRFDKVTFKLARSTVGGKLVVKTLDSGRVQLCLNERVGIAVVIR